MENKKVSAASKDFGGEDKVKKSRRPMKKKVCEFCEKEIGRAHV